VLDPGPLVAQIDPDVLEPVLGRVSWLSPNSREAGLLTGTPEPAAAARAVERRAPGLVGLVVRDGARGCDVVLRGQSAEHVAAPAVAAADVVDTNGAGDVHVGAFVAALARGEDPMRAAAAANEAAAVAVTRFGPAAAPRRTA
jgi:sugar/nucleoside kinase (ribokinase family)